MFILTYNIIGVAVNAYEKMMWICSRKYVELYFTETGNIISTSSMPWCIHCPIRISTSSTPWCIHCPICNGNYPKSPTHSHPHSHPHLVALNELKFCEKKIWNVYIDAQYYCSGCEWIRRRCVYLVEIYAELYITETGNRISTGINCCIESPSHPYSSGLCCWDPWCCV